MQDMLMSISYGHNWSATDYIFKESMLRRIIWASCCSGYTLLALQSYKRFCEEIALQKGKKGKTPWHTLELEARQLRIGSLYDIMIIYPSIN